MYRAHVLLTGEARDADQARILSHHARIRRQRMRNAAKSAMHEAIAAIGMAALFICTVPFLLCI